MTEARLTPTLTGFQELRDDYVRLQLRGDRREALRFLDDLVTRGQAGVGITPQAQKS